MLRRWISEKRAAQNGGFLRKIFKTLLKNYLFCAAGILIEGGRLAAHAHYGATF
jgi:hypothetical protein